MKKYSTIFHGRSTHAAAYPDEGKNALLAATTAVNNLYTIPRHKDGASRVNVGQFRSDCAHNIISDHAEFKYEIRGVSNQILEHMDACAMDVINGAAEMHGCTVEILDDGGYINAPNSPELKARIKQAALKANIPEEAIVDGYWVMGSEDATFIMEQVQKNGGQASYMGIGSPTRGGHHNEKFDFDEDLMLVGVEILWNTINLLLEG